MAALLGAGALVVWLAIERYRLVKRLAPIAHVDEELARLKENAARELGTAERFKAEHADERKRLRDEYAAARAQYESVRKELALLEEDLEDISFGIYKPHFTYESSEEYKAALERLRAQAREMVRAGRAAIGPANLTIDGNKREGQRHVKQSEKLLLRAFNGECEAALANVSWNNVDKMQERVEKSFDAINQLGSVLHVAVTPAYRNLRIEELRITQEAEQKRYAEREEQRQIREKMREEERAQRELDSAHAETEREEERFTRALEKAREEIARATGLRVDELQSHIAQLEKQIADVQQRQRAIAQAQLTRSGHVYVISNVGSFGDRVFKVGMSRRLDPLERVHELGDAAVPFPYDVHAMVYSQDAPALEHAIHQAFNERRINLVNLRKEFFEVTAEELEACIRNMGHAVELTKLAEARQFRQSRAIRAQPLAVEPTLSPQTFPTDPFATTTSGTSTSEHGA